MDILFHSLNNHLTTASSKIYLGTYGLHDKDPRKIISWFSSLVMPPKNLGAFIIQSSMVDIFSSLIELQEGTREHCFALNWTVGHRSSLGEQWLAACEAEFRSAKGITSVLWCLPRLRYAGVTIEVTSADWLPYVYSMYITKVSKTSKARWLRQGPARKSQVWPRLGRDIQGVSKAWARLERPSQAHPVVWTIFWNPSTLSSQSRHVTSSKIYFRLVFYFILFLERLK